MSEANPTPGPWRLEIGMDVEAVHANGRRVGFGDAIYHPEHVADARLFVAAPELLAACEAVRVFVAQDFDGLDPDDKGLGLSGPYRAAYKLLLAAILKAKGEP